MNRDNRMVAVDNARVAQSYTVREFCSMVGISTPTYYNLMNRKTVMNMSILQLMCDVLRIPVEDEIKPKESSASTPEVIIV